MQSLHEEHDSGGDDSGGEAVYECAVCMCDLSDGERPVDPSAIDNDAPDETMLWSACYVHCVCKGCLLRLALSFGQAHPIGPEHPMIRCPYPFESCVSVFTDLPNYFPHATIERLIPDDEARSKYVAHANRYQFPGHELVACPRPVASGGKCGAGILIPVEDIRNRGPGHLIMQCDQTIQCQRQSCYHCHGLVGRGIHHCEACLTATENANPSALNHYFYRPGKRFGDDLCALLRNDEVTADLATQQILELIECEKMHIRCAECLTMMQKTEQCNTLEHCGVERCYSCGRTGTRNNRLGDHWDSTGISGCPRFDHSVFWNVVGECRFRCSEGNCYSEDLGDCTVPDHASGIQTMVDLRRLAHVYHALKSLLQPVRDETMKRLLQIPRAVRWLPRWNSSDYRTYLPEPVMRMLVKARTIVDSVGSDTVSEADQPTYDFARDFVSKASELTFQATATVVAAVAKPVVKPRHQIIFESFRTKYGSSAAQTKRSGPSKKIKARSYS